MEVDSTGTYLVSDPGNSLLGPLTSGTLSNTQCTLNSSSVVNSGNTSTVTLSITFKAPFNGAKNLYLYTEDTLGNSTNFQLFGAYTVQ